MQLRHVEYAVAVADAGGVSAAAEAVHVSQPALSRQLRQLEADLGVSLFERRGSGPLRPSRTCVALLPAFRDLLAAADLVAEEARVHAAGGLERVVVAAPTVTLTDVVSPFVATTGPLDPVLDVRPEDGRRPAEMLAAGADLAIGTRPPAAPARWRPLARLPVWAYVRPDDEWAGRSQVALSELLERRLVLLPRAFTSREALEAALTATGASEPAGVLEAASGPIAQALTAAGRGVAVVSDDARHELVPLAIRLPGGGRLAIRLVVAWDGTAPAQEGLSALADRLAAFVTGRYGG
ncbi:LysR family transcriptional regulator [Nocardioides sp. GY 10127]|uniref:LysR family transcriptional regulator n=1 Tax=Nocardioides sp. GY 10127 TaxID=2569762 RepID=UPI0010A8F46D|nr:LysR family transcriptional regulator [Nocardioides sp. GY 10127]TIC79978.1 LysR family transcriptional regulator [Nocardioides sp. GY 10127]